MTSVSDAAYLTVHDYPGGAEPLAVRLCMSAQVLRNKVNPNCTSNALSLDEAVRMMVLSGDHRIFRAIGDELAQGEQGAPAGGLFSLVLRHDVADGDFASALQSALDDGVITPNEMLAVASAGDAVLRTLGQVLRKMAASVSRGPASASVG